MTNKMIILLESIKLMGEGILEGTGEKVVVDMSDGTKKEYDIPEVIHTYQHWKSIGYKVKHGEHAIAKFPIWKYTKKKNKDMTEEEAQENGYCFMKESAWFKSSQVEEVPCEN